MGISPDRYSLEYDARLVEEAVLERITGQPEEDAFRRGRNRIYELKDIEERERQFQQFHAAWFSRLHLGRPLSEALEEQPIVLRETRRCCVVPARSSQEEGADLHKLRGAEAQPGKPDLATLIRLKPTRFLDPAGLRSLLRHELMHVTDMLDPAFGYEPVLPKSEAGALYDNLIRDRYRTLWSTWIDGRLSRRGLAAADARQKRLAEFAAAFSVTEEPAREKFEGIFGSDFQTHAGLLATALNPSFGRIPSRGGKRGAQPCPLCRCPTYQLLDVDPELLNEIRDEVVRDFTHWQPEHGLCRQCADLYRARNLSRAAAASLPRI